MTRKKQPSKKTDPADVPITANDVLTYLLANPNFLNEHPELFGVLIPPGMDMGDNIRDMQSYMIDRLQGEFITLRSDHFDLIATARENLSVQQQVHHAIVDLLHCRNVADIAEVLSQDMCALFDVDIIRLCLESDIPRQDEEASDALRFLPASVILRIVGEDDTLLGNDVSAVKPVFEDVSALVSSFAIVRLTPEESSRIGLLAFGVREEERFHPGQGTELLRFLGDVMEHVLDLCLKESNN